MLVFLDEDSRQINLYILSHVSNYLYERVFGIPTDGNNSELESFGAEAENIVSLINSTSHSIDISCILLTSRVNCRNCGKLLKVDKKYSNIISMIIVLGHQLEEDMSNDAVTAK